jgi:hypothetical protein
MRSQAATMWRANGQLVRNLSLRVRALQVRRPPACKIVWRMRGVDVGKAGAPALGPGGQVRQPQAVAVAVFDLERRKLCAQVRPLAAGHDPHRLRPGSQLVAAPAG